MLAKMQNTKSPNKKFMKLNLEDKIRSVYEDLQLTAKQAGIALPH
jgi:hypothetical protein